MNSTLDSTTLVTAMLWLLALALPLAMLLWMAAQFIAIRSLGRRVRALEAAASAQRVVPVASDADARPAPPPESIRVADIDAVPVAPDVTAADRTGPVRDDEDRDAIEVSEGHA